MSRLVLLLVWLAVLSCSSDPPISSQKPEVYPAAKVASAADRAALVAFYRATGGNGWDRKDNWLSDAPVWQWYGVDANLQGRVVQLRILQNNLRGKIPSQLGLIYLMAPASSPLISQQKSEEGHSDSTQISGVSFLRSFAIFLLILTLPTSSYGGYRNNKTRLDSIRISTESVAHAHRHPIKLSCKVFIRKPCPKEHFFLESRILQKFPIRQENSLSIMAKTLNIGKKNPSTGLTARPIGTFSRTPNRNQLNINRHHKNVKSRSFARIFDKTPNPELFPDPRLSGLPSSDRILSCLNLIAIITKPRPLIQTQSISSDFKHLPSQSNLIPSMVRINSRDYYQPTSSNSHNRIRMFDEDFLKQTDWKKGDPIWPFFLLLFLGFGIVFLGGYFLFCTKRFFSGILCWIAYFLIAHYTLPYIDDWHFEKGRAKRSLYRPY